MNIAKLYQLIQSRISAPVTGSRTNHFLSQGLDRIAQKVGEEAVEVVIACKNDDKAKLVGELTDLTYRISILMAYKGVSWEDIENELNIRHSTSHIS